MPDSEIGSSYYDYFRNCPRIMLPVEGKSPVSYFWWNCCAYTDGRGPWTIPFLPVLIDVTKPNQAMLYWCRNRLWACGLKIYEFWDWFIVGVRFSPPPILCSSSIKTDDPWQRLTSLNHVLVICSPILAHAIKSMEDGVLSTWLVCCCWRAGGLVTHWSCLKY